MEGGNDCFVSLYLQGVEWTLAGTDREYVVPRRALYTAASNLEKQSHLSKTQADALSRRTLCAFPCLRKESPIDDAPRCVYKKDISRMPTSFDQQRLHQAASIIQRFFVQVRTQAQAFQRKQSSLCSRLRELAKEKQQELDVIALQIKQMKLRLLEEAQKDVETDAIQEDLDSQMSLDESRAVVELQKKDIMAFKKQNAYLQKRCSQLRTHNKKLEAESKEVERRHNSCLVSCREFSLEKVEKKALLCQYQKDIGDHQSRLALVENQWHVNKLANKRVREFMSKIVRMVEDRVQEAEHDDKWDLVDKLYQLQRGTHWNRKCIASCIKKYPSGPKKHPKPRSKELILSPHHTHRANRQKGAHVRKPSADRRCYKFC